MYSVRIKNKYLLAYFYLFILLMPISLIAQDISIDDFRIPTSKYQRLLGGFYGGWDKNDDYYYCHYSLLQSYQPRNSSSSQTANLQANLNYNLFNFSEDHSLEVAVLFDVYGWYHKSNDNSIYQYNTSSYNTNISKSTVNSYYITFIPSVRYSKYIEPDLWHWFIESSINYSFDEYRRKYEEVLHSISSSFTSYSDGTSYIKSNSWSASFGGGIGYGKMRDGSSIFTVLRVLDKLREDSILIRSLTKEETIKLVNLLAKKDEYAYSQDRYEKFLMEDLYAELKNMGVLKNDVVTAYSVLRAVEAISERVEPRLFGWRARLGIQRQYNEQIMFNTYSSPDYPHLWSSQDFLTLAFDYGYPVSLNLHITSNFSMNIPRIEYQRKINFQFNANGIYQIGEMIDATLSGSCSRSQQLINLPDDQNIFTRYIQYEIKTSFRFFIENNVYFSINGYYRINQNSNYDINRTEKSYFEGPGINFGINYRFI